MFDKYYIRTHVASFRLKAAQKYNISPEKCHIGHLVLQGMLERPQRINQIDTATDKMETNESVAKRSIRLASAMNKYGLEPGDAVVLMAPNHLDTAVAFYACHFNGLSVCGIDHNYAPSDLKKLFPYINPKMVFCDKSCEEKIKEAFKANNLQGEIVIFDEKQSDLEAFIGQYKGTDINFRPAEFNLSEIPAWLLLTSGTTGLPKVAIVPYDTLLNAVCCWWDLYCGKLDSALVMGNLHWLSALVFYISGPLRNYARVQSSQQLTPQSLVYVINKYRPNCTAWTPYLLGQFLAVGEKTCDLSCFQHIVIGGSAISKELLDQFKLTYTSPLTLVYGMTELMVPIFDFDMDTPEESTGHPSDKYQFRLVDEDGNIVDKPHKNGELWVKGDDFFKGYLNNLEETRTIYTDDGWFKTGDIFYRDDQEFYYFVERKRLLIKHFGYLIAPLQLEEVIKRHPAVSEVCVVGVPDPDCMELPIAAIIKKNGSHFDPQEIFDLLKSSLSELKQIRGGLFFVESMPVTPSGKINRSKVLELALTTPKILPRDNQIKV